MPPEAVAYVEVAPRPEAAAYLTEICGVSYEGVEAPALLLPQGTATFVVSSSKDARRLRIEVKGPQTRAAQMPRARLRWALGVRLRAGRGRELLGVPLDELTDRTVAVDALWGKDGERLGERMMGASRMKDRLRVLEEMLVARLGLVRTTPSTSALVDAATARLERGACERVSELADHLGISPRQLRRQFLDHVGMTPKAYASLLRFRRATDALEAAGFSNFADLAARSGYYDQAHMIADFRERTGTTPRTFRALVNSTE
ncbi:Transcriptional regulator, AraC family [Labilithrix luteola]|uniref:Transcriptional regulator, AraC family n=1 Tax=Labilithrix luteola TaxID=1391654 RepID=A0A0K1PXZ1_9BACT|nr:helix-turn-helix transcriptional regulator [Labilithrix luteola]AKU98377.1 Transcriptional regulator, AraC family [Labilithrix luteola]